MQRKKLTHQNTVKLSSIPFYFVRHGQTDWNKEQRFMGQTDIPLNEVGLQQAHAAAKSVAHLEISKIVSSPLKRALHTAEIIGVALNKPITILDELKECSLGIMEGQHKGTGEWLEYWKKGGATEGAEHWSNFVSRVVRGLNAALENNKDEKPILIVAHGGVYRVIQQEILKLRTADGIPNCSVVFHKPSAEDNMWSVHAIDDFN